MRTIKGIVKRFYYTCMIGLCEIKAERAFNKLNSDAYMRWSLTRIDYVVKRAIS